jgi:hypothetical protein
MRRLSRWLLVALLLGLWLGPWLARLETPLVFGDDVLRLVDVQTLPLSHRLVRPFNEHFAPLFELWTEAAWTACGRKLVAVPIVFTAASVMPFLLIVPILWRTTARAWGDEAAAALSATLLATTPVHAETVFWFSASSFVWALLCTVLGLAAAARGGRWGLAAAAFCSAAAPVWSGIGLLAGPAAAALVWCGGGKRRSSLVPLAGTAAAVLLSLLFRHQEAVAKSAREYLDPLAGLAEIPAALSYLIGVGYLGRAIRWEPSTWAGLLALAGLAWISARSPRERRGWVAAGWVLLVGGYALTFGIRVHVILGDSLVRTTRYHLFPCLGLAMILGASLRPPAAGVVMRRRLAGVAVAALSLVVLNTGQRAERLRYYDFLGEQRPFLAALDHLADEAKTRGIGRGDVLSAIEPSRPRWVHPGCNAMDLLPRGAGSAAAPGGDLRAALLACLTPAERAALGSQADLSGRLAPALSPTIAAERVRAAGLQIVGTRLETPGAPAFVEYQSSTGGTVLGLPATLAGAELEIWWSDESRGWRSAVVRLPAGPAERWALPLGDFSGSIRTFRLVVRAPGTYELGELSVGGGAIARAGVDGSAGR